MTADDLFTRCLARLEAGLSILPDKSDESAESTLLALWLEVAGRPPTRSTSKTVDLPQLSDPECVTLDAMITDRLAGKPLAHIVGKQVFMGLEFVVDATALIPRKETELLACAAIDKIAGLDQSGAGVKVIDVCTGVGNLAVTFSSRFSGLEVLACDLSADALTLAEENAFRLGVKGRTVFECGDMLDPFDDPKHHNTVDILVCNPPYIPSSKVTEMPAEISTHEPEIAFDGGELGINMILTLIRQSVRFLKSEGWLMFEVGAGQGEFLHKKLERSGVFSDVDSKTNEEGVIRVLMAQK